MPTCERWLTVARGEGRSTITRAYEVTLDAQVAPACGQVLSMWESAAPAG